MPTELTAAPMLLRAAHVAPMVGPLIDDGAVLVLDGRIAAVGPWDDLRSFAGRATVDDLGDALLLPGLVNPHVHLELSDLTPGERPTSFVDWLLGVMSAGPPPSPAGDARVLAATRNGIARCLRFGVTTVGDVSRFPHATRQALDDSPLRAVSFGEVTAMAGRRHLLEPRLAAAMAPSPAPGRIVSAVSPHAPYSVEPSGYVRCVAAARAAGVPVASHVAESADEAAFLADHAGPFRRLWDAIGGLDAGVPRFAGGPVRLAATVGLLDAPGGVLAHVNHADDAEVALLAGGRASVVYCPRTHAYFGHPPHRWRAMLAAGVNVAVGTDSTASSPDLNLVDDLRVLRRLAPDVEPATIWEMATTRAARALGLSDVGRIAAGCRADLVAFRAASADPLKQVLDAQRLPEAIWAVGRRVECGIGK